MLRKAEFEEYCKRTERQEVEKVKRKRDERRAFFNCQTGLEIIKDMIMQSGLFDLIDPKDEAMVAGRNFALSFLDSIGLFDEEGLETMIQNRLNSANFSLPDEE